MKRFVIIILAIICSFSISAVNDGVRSMLEQTIIEKDSLNKRIERLKFDSATSAFVIKELRLDTAKLSILSKELQAENDSLLTRLNFVEASVDSIQHLLGKCGKEYAYLSHKLESTEIMKSKQFNDSLSALNSLLLELNDRLDSMNKFELSLKSRLEVQEAELKKFSSVVENLSSMYSSASIDVLFPKYPKSTLLSHKEIFQSLGLSCPEQLNQTIACHAAAELLRAPYNSRAIEKVIAHLPSNSRIASDIKKKLSNYSNLLKEASDIWTKLSKDVFSEPISEDNFDQLTAKRKVWQSIQPFLTKYPNLSSEYPYLYSECQKILSDVWRNANNFPKSNPFVN